ncbi:MAG: TonB family protein [Alistipes sp.]|jgi:TonB family protein|nr:TonB family protein [Alistipes sp.]
MNYYEQDGGRSRLWGIAGVVLYVALCVGVMFITYVIETPEPELGIVVDFGATETGLGEVDPAPGDVEATPAAPTTDESAAPEVTTVDDPEAPAIETETTPDTPAPTVTPAPEAVAPAREVDRRALFPGRTEGSDAASQGTAGGPGNQGSTEGAPGGGDSAGGTGSSGFSLDGRYMVGNLPRPAYTVEEEGRVVIRITVNAAGVVTGAMFEQAGSTTNHGELVSAARTAALRARFTPGEAEVQTGTITYIFRLY